MGKRDGSEGHSLDPPVSSLWTPQNVGLRFGPVVYIWASRAESGKGAHAEVMDTLHRKNDQP